MIEITETDWKVTDDAGETYALSKGDFAFEKDGCRISIDLVFNAVHGAPGEDGQLAALWQLQGIPHTSAESYLAALTYNKRDCLAVLRPYGIPMATSYALNQGEAFEVDTIVEKVGLPCFVKANRAGSSFGVCKAHTASELPKAIETAFLEDTQLIIEKALDGREVSVGAMWWPDEKVEILGITEIISHNDFFDYAAKYEGQSTEVTPAAIPKEWEQKINEIVRLIYDKLGLKSLTRSEFIMVNDTPHLIEINTVPGLTEQSIIPQQVQNSGKTLAAFFDILLQNALATKL